MRTEYLDVIGVLNHLVMAKNLVSFSNLNYEF
jgi:hypothetical protein